MITREDIENAALAAGHTIYGWYEPNGDGADFADIGPADECIAWAPHRDDGDMARLAAEKLAADVAAEDLPVA